MFLAVAVPALFPPRPFRDVRLDLGLGKLTKDELKRIFKLSPLLFVVVMIVASIMTQIAKLCGAEDPEQALIKLALSADVPTFCVIFISSVFIAPVTEELAFRRTIFEKLHSSLPLQSAAAITSLLFALVHFSPWQIPPLFLLAFLFQQEYIRAANKTTATILMHAIYNGLINAQLQQSTRFLANIQVEGSYSIPRKQYAATAHVQHLLPTILRSVMVVK